MNETRLSTAIKQLRKEYNLTQQDLAYKSGVGLRFVRELEQGKPTVRMDKVNQVLELFNLQLGPVPMERRTDEWDFVSELQKVQFKELISNRIETLSMPF